MAAEMSAGQLGMAELSMEESLRLLGSVSLGRIVFTHRALPAVRPVNHFLDNGDIIIRTSPEAAVVSAVDPVRGVVVAYEADIIDPDTHLGWCVIVTGTAHLVRDPDQVARYLRMSQPWVEGRMDQPVRIHPEIVTGFRLGSAG
jgi:Pyridoxamine 5'-phosphate oxidase